MAPPTGVHERDRHRRGSVGGGGGRREAGPDAHAALLQRQGLPFPGEILQHAGVMELHALQRASKRTTGEERGPFENGRRVSMVMILCTQTLPLNVPS